MIKARYQKMYTEKYKQDMDFVIIGERYIGPFVDMDVAQKAVSAINKQFAPQPKHTRTEYKKVAYSSAWKAAKDHEERKVELWRKSDLSEAIKGSNWKAIQSPSEAAQYHFDLYLKVEKEIDWRDELNEWQHTKKIGIYTPLDFTVAHLISAHPDKFLELCRVALRANGELD